MADHKSAIKRAKQNTIRNLRNKAVRTRVKSVIKDVRIAIQSNSKENAISALKVAVPTIDTAAGKRVIHRNNAARKISRLTRQVNALG
ncbi:MAG: 30S ribosomal protein S20 [Deltaproteobacteria bacterium]|nr:30S ribosomal protein S20 [Deltaproteobacteria bacterium]